MAKKKRTYMRKEIVVSKKTHGKKGYKEETNGKMNWGFPQANAGIAGSIER